jgi:hypothetical protein
VTRLAVVEFKVELTTSFLQRLAAIEVFLIEAHATPAYDNLLFELRSTVIPNLRQYPRLGRPYLEHPLQSVEALNQLAQLPAGSAKQLHEYQHGHYLLLYALAEPEHAVYLLSIRHFKQLSFNFAALWN